MSINPSLHSEYPFSKPGSPIPCVNIKAQEVAGLDYRNHLFEAAKVVDAPRVSAVVAATKKTKIDNFVTVVFMLAMMVIY
ncbi:MAG: hypothetical protein WAK17_30270 [Candidatus Nitrosopolaris sp.]